MTICRDGRVHIGDIISSINGHVLHSRSEAEVENLLSHSNIVQLVIHRVETSHKEQVSEWSATEWTHTHWSVMVTLRTFISQYKSLFVHCAKKHLTLNRLTEFAVFVYN